MTTDIRLFRPPRSADVTLFSLGLVALIASVWSVLVFGTTGLPRILALGAAGLALVLTIVWRRPYDSLAWIPVLIVPPQFLNVFAHEVIVMPLMVFMLFYGHRRNLKWVFQLDPIEVVLLLFFSWAVFGFFWVREWWWWLFGVRKLLLGWIALWVAWRWCRFIPPHRLLIGITATSVFLSLAVMERAVSYGWFSGIPHSHMRRQSTDLGWGNSNYIAALLTLLLPTVISQAMTAKSRVARTLGIIGIPLTAMVVTIASSRGGSLLTLAIALFMVFRSKIKSWVLFVSAPAAIALLTLGPGAKLLLSRFQSIEDMYSVVIRFYIWRAAWFRVVEFWPRGLGLNQGFGHPDKLHLEATHNEWLAIASELSLVGLVLWVTFLVLVYRRILRVARHPATRVEGQALQLTFWIIQLNCMFEPTIFGVQYQFLMMWIFGAYFGWAERMWEQSGAGAADPVPASPATARSIALPGTAAGSAAGS